MFQKWIFILKYWMIGKKEHENPSVGLILCATKNDEVVEYAMSKSMSPMLYKIDNS